MPRLMVKSLNPGPEAGRGLSLPLVWRCHPAWSLLEQAASQMKPGPSWAETQAQCFRVRACHFISVHAGGVAVSRDCKPPVSFWLQA